MSYGSEWSSDLGGGPRFNASNKERKEAMLGALLWKTDTE